MPASAHTLRAEGHDASEDGTGRQTLVPTVRHAAGEELLDCGHAAAAGDRIVTNESGIRCSACSHVDGPKSFNWQQGDAEYQLADDAHTLGTTTAPAVLEPHTFEMKGRGGHTVPEAAKPGVADTLRAGGGPRMVGPVPVQEPASVDLVQVTSPANRQDIRPDGTARTLHSLGGSAVLLPKPVGADLYNGDVTGDVSHCLRSGATDGHGAAITSYGVRRLTPVECERLQAFPDGWTEPAGSDSARYRALGNAITVNVATWLFRRIRNL